MTQKDHEHIHKAIIEALKDQKADPLQAMASLAYVLGLACAATGMNFESFKACLVLTIQAFESEWKELSESAKLLMIMKDIK